MGIASAHRHRGRTKRIISPCFLCASRFAPALSARSYAASRSLPAISSVRRVRRCVSPAAALRAAIRHWIKRRATKPAFGRDLVIWRRCRFPSCAHHQRAAARIASRARDIARDADRFYPPINGERKVTRQDRERDDARLRCYQHIAFLRTAARCAVPLFCDANIAFAVYPAPACCTTFDAFAYTAARFAVPAACARLGLPQCCTQEPLRDARVLLNVPFDAARACFAAAARYRIVLLRAFTSTAARHELDDAFSPARLRAQ